MIAKEELFVKFYEALWGMGMGRGAVRKLTDRTGGMGRGMGKATANEEEGF